MPAIKLNISLNERVAAAMRRRASELGKPASRYVSDLILADERSSLEDLAEEGYRVLAADTGRFVAAAAPTDSEGWPEWEDGNAAP